MAASKPFDAAVIGAGPAGSATARRLAAAGCHVLLVERTTFEPPRVGESLAPDVQPLLMELDVWNRFSEIRAVPSWGTRSVWGDCEPQEYSHMMSPFGCGWHVDRVAFDRMLAGAASAAGADLRLGTTLLSSEDGAEGWALVLESEGRRTTARARMLVDATGRGARVGRRLGAVRRRADALVGVSAWFDGVDTSQEGFTLVEAEPDGWWYSAPAGEGAMAAMLMTDGDLAGGGVANSASAWQLRLRAAPLTAGRLRAASMVLGPRAFSAASHRLCRADSAGRWLAVGDAAIAVDPISGSGVVRALRTATRAASTVLGMLESPTGSTLAEYESASDSDWSTYLEERASYYGVEERWARAQFWRRRH